MSPKLNCSVCKDPIDKDEGQFVGEPGPPWRDYRQAWHFQCLPAELAISGQIKLEPEQLMRWNAWSTTKALKANTALRFRTNILYSEIRRLMTIVGVPEHEIKDFAEAFTLYDDDLDPKPRPETKQGPAP